MRALVVDDSQAMRIIIRKILKEFAFEVTEAQHGRDALEALGRTGAVDIAFVDWNMPEMNGLEFVQAARSRPELATMLIMMVTTEIESAQMVKALEAGANEYLMKPFTKAAMVEKLELLGISASSCAESAS
ncbi:MAG TPA: response regulator [Candidatus Binatia bacterium]|nr:response regulator [Candidatus Binatia bacterium]